MKQISEMNIGELAAYISTHLKKNGIEVVLTGGSCVSIYSENKYISMDLDFVEMSFYKRKEIKRILTEIGFQEENRYFKNPESDFLVEFPPGPLAIGSEPIKGIITLEFETGNLRLISPTECVKDRLAGFYFWNDRQSLEQAILVASNNQINMNEIRKWSMKEGEEKKFQMFLEKIYTLN